LTGQNLDLSTPSAVRNATFTATSPNSISVTTIALAWTSTTWFDSAGAVWTKEAGRPAHVYVFAWNGRVGTAADHRNPDQWEFFVIPTRTLPTQKTLRLSRVSKIVGDAGSFMRPERCAEGLSKIFPAAKRASGTKARQST